MSKYVRFSQTPEGKRFYQSAKWRKLRERYVKERQLTDGGLCEICRHRPGEELHHIKPLTKENYKESLATDSDNLKFVCRECNFRTRDDNFGRFAPTFEVTAGAYFDMQDVDNSGETPKLPKLKEQKRYLVYGAPFSGKSDYVKKHMKHGDFVLNIENLFDVFGGCRYNFPQDLFGNVCDIRDYVLGKIERGEINAKTVWVIETLPEKKRRDNRAKQLNAELVFIESTRDDCISKVYKSKKCRDKDRFLRYVSQWHDSQG